MIYPVKLGLKQRFYIYTKSCVSEEILQMEYLEHRSNYMFIYLLLYIYIYYN